MPDQGWPTPPPDWPFWGVPEDPDADRRRRRGRLRSVSFPVATAAARSDVSLDALFPERSREGDPAYGHDDTAEGAAPVYVPGGSRKPPPEPDDHRLTGWAPPAEQAGSAASVDAERSAQVATQGIRLSPILRVVADPSGLRVQFRVGGAAEAALVEVLRPAIVAASPGAAPGDPGVMDRGDPARGGLDDWQGSLRRLLRGRREPDPSSRTPAGTPPAPPGSLALRALAGRQLDARRAGDRETSAALERQLCSLHRHAFGVIRRPPDAEPIPMTAAELSDLRAKALLEAGATEQGLSREEAAERGQVASERIQAFVTAHSIAARVRAGHRDALVAAAWRLLESHEATAVIALVDEAMRLAGSDVTCLDAGTDPVTQRAYVTVLLRFPTIGIVAEEALEPGKRGRLVRRQRLPRERNDVYAVGLASAVLAAVKHVDSIAIAADEVNVVVVRPTHNGRDVEPIYAGTLDREDVSLRHPEADPLPLFLSSAAPHGIRFHGPAHSVSELDLSADRDWGLREIIDACRDAIAAENRP